MILTIPQVLTPEEVRRLTSIAATATFVDGRISAPHNPTKVNQQLETQSAAYQESATLLAQALARSPEFQRFAFYKRFAPPLLCKYHPGMRYGAHPDSAYVNSAVGLLRSDVSCTIWLNPPESYEGGALRIRLGDRAIDVKLPPGAAVVYPSTTIHEVLPVTSGERLVAITFIESQIIDETKRHLLYTLNEVAALEGNNISWENRVQLEHVRQSLHRMWSS